jgi:hypothetical protein
MMYVVHDPVAIQFQISFQFVKCLLRFVILIFIQFYVLFYYSV